MENSWGECLGFISVYVIKYPNKLWREKVYFSSQFRSEPVISGKRKSQERKIYFPVRNRHAFYMLTFSSLHSPGSKPRGWCRPQWRAGLSTSIIVIKTSPPTDIPAHLLELDGPSLKISFPVTPDHVPMTS